MTVPLFCLALHLLAMSLWLGHMFVWALVTGPAMKKMQPPETAAMLRERSLFRGGLGWPALAVLIPTGLYLLSLRGIPPAALFSAATYQGPQGNVLAVKLAAVLVMVGYQSVWSHKPAPIAIYFDILAAFTVIGASVLLVRGFIA